MTEPRCLVLRLAGPLQSWGLTSRHNRRATAGEPTKSGVVGLLAASQGRRRTDPIEDLAALVLGVRIDQPGQLRRDYHTVSSLDGRPLPSAMVSGKGQQRGTSPAKHTHVTERFYLEEAVFVAAVHGPGALLEALETALRSPAFPLALGRRSCVPTQPLVLAAPDGGLHPGAPLDVLAQVPWQAGPTARKRMRANGELSDTVSLPVAIDDPAGDELRQDAPVSFDPKGRRFTSRRVAQRWVVVDSGLPKGSAVRHDPFALLGW